MVNLYYWTTPNRHNMACYPWIVPHERQGQQLNDFPHLTRWFQRVGARPAVARAYERAKTINTKTGFTPEEKRVLFGQDASTVRAKR